MTDLSEGSNSKWEIFKTLGEKLPLQKSGELTRKPCSRATEKPLASIIIIGSPKAYSYSMDSSVGDIRMAFARSSSKQQSGRCQCRRVDVRLQSCSLREFRIGDNYC